MFTRTKPQPALPHSPEELEKAALQPSIHDLSINELKEFHQHVGEVLAQKQAQARVDFKRDFVDRMSELGLTVDDLKPVKVKKERAKRDVQIMYRDPEHPENTWSGAGKPKKWLREKLDQGYTLDQFAVGTSGQN